jgi:2EXR family
MDEVKQEAAPTEASHSVANLARTFTLFPKLPTEMRTMIWKLTLEPRMVEIDFDDEKGFYSKINYPVGLTVFQDSRQAVIGYYSLCFGSVWLPHKTRFNFSLDAIYLDKSFIEHVRLLFSSLMREEVKKIQYFAIDEMMEYTVNCCHLCSEHGYDLMGGICSSLERMGSLNEVVEANKLWTWARTSRGLLL